MKDKLAHKCPICKGQCCRDQDYGYRVEHMGAECYEHVCDYCNDGDGERAMKRVKLFSAINFSHDWDCFQKIGEAISEWTEISDEEFGVLEKHRYDIECDLKLKKVLRNLESLVIVREFSEEDLKKTMISVSDIVSSISAKEKAKREREEKRLATIESRKKKKELAQLKKLQEKWGETKDE